MTTLLPLILQNHNAHDLRIRAQCVAVTVVGADPFTLRVCRVRDW
jgi:hypothetical protein